MPEADYRAGRAAVLKRFLAAPRIYHTQILFEEGEAAGAGEHTDGVGPIACTPSESFPPVAPLMCDARLSSIGPRGLPRRPLQTGGREEGTTHGPEPVHRKGPRGALPAQKLAARLNHQQIDVEHVLLSLLDQEKGLAPAILKKAGVSVDALTVKLQRELEKLPRVTGDGRRNQRPHAAGSTS